MNSKIEVTKPFLPPQSEYMGFVQDIWDSQWLTNDGPILKKFETELTEYLSLSNFQFVSNGTIALQLALRAFAIEGEVITTPFSFVATSSALVWERCKPVFVDIDPLTFNIDPDKIESYITPDTKAILATHTFGNPCDIDQLMAIGHKYQIKIIFDAAHCFGTLYKNRSVLNFGDISAISFHATKLFHTVEGGGIVTQDPTLQQKISLLKNFGHDGPGNINGLGINAKNSEFHAAMGLANLKYADEILESRKKCHQHYDNHLHFKEFAKQIINPDAHYNFSYYPLVFSSEDICSKVLRQLQNQNIYPRRYFTPALSMLDYVPAQKMKIAEDISQRILCLPLYHDLTEDKISSIAELINKTVG